MQPPIKKYIKAVVPSSTIRFFRERSDEAQLSKADDLNFETANLIKKSNIDLNAILTDTETEQNWQRDNALIDKIFENEDKSLGVNPGDRQAIYYLLHALKPKKVLEVGTHIGASTLYFAKALQSIHGNDNVQIDTVDIYDVNSEDSGAWKEFNDLKAPRDMLSDIGCDNIVNFHDCGAQPFMQYTEDKYDFIFLDGDHSSCAVYEELAKALPLLNENGVILMHDVYPDFEPLFPDGNVIGGPWRAIQRAIEQQPKLKIMPLGSLPWQTKQMVNRTSLALLSQS